MIILVVDDEPETCSEMAQELGALGGVSVVSFSNPAAALDWLQANQPDLILVDYQMPGTNGIELIRWVRQREKDFDVPMLMLTGQDDGHLLGDAVAAGANDFVRKPVQRAELVARTRSMLNLRAKTRELLDALAKLQELATTDSLTRTHNRRFFMERLDEEVKRAWRHQQPLSVIMLDLDHFKAINDTYGHACGDLVLETLAAGMKDALRASDFIGRIGGEEFAVGLPHTAGTGADILAERMRHRIEVTEIPFAGVGLRLTVSGGVAQLVPGESPDSLLARADAALYVAKHAGRNQIVGAGGRG